jgi:hypothetical protein
VYNFLVVNVSSNIPLIHSKLRIYLLVGYQIRYNYLAATKSIFYPSSVALYCCQQLRRNIAPAWLEEIAELAEETLTLTA